MEHEDRYGDERGECLQCGYFYELTSVGLMLFKMKSTYRKLRKKLVKAHFNRINEILIRIGFIEKTPDTISKAHIISTWFSIPSSHQQRETKIQWVELTKEQRKQFDRREWTA